MEKIIHEDISGSIILIADDIKSNIEMLGFALKNEYKIDTASNGTEVLEYINNKIPDLILLDIMMPKIDGYEVCKKLKNSDRTKDIPVIFISAMDDATNKSKGFNIGAVDYITKPFDISDVKARIKTHLSLQYAREALKNQKRNLEIEVKKRTQELYDTRLEIIFRLGRAAEYRDNETGMHIKRMSHYCKAIAKAIGMDKKQCALILHASPMHDVGKIGIPDNILLKPGKLEPKEFEIMKTHTTIGEKLLSGDNFEELELARIIALTHHERWDGAGYPNGLAGENIPIEGRIAAVGDVFDALISERPYKKAWPVDKAVNLMKEGNGTQFDPEIIKIFPGILDKILEINSMFPDTE